MTMAPRRVRVRCPRCKTWYEDWYCPTINLTLEKLTKEQVEEMATVCCPNCGRRIWLASIIVEAPGQWSMFGSRRSLPVSRTKKRLKRRIKIEWMD